MIIAGLDEAGRGALAGPVVAGVVILPESFRDVIFSDSKVLTHEKRVSLFEIIKKTCDWGVAMVSASEIDEIGIKPATNKAMQLALAQLKKIPDKLLVDGRDKFSFDIPSEDVIRGDSIHQVIAGASIVAKVTRDEIMVKLSLQYPEFNFEKNKGYGCAHHLNLIEQEIYSPEHRKSYDPLKTYLTQGRLF